MKFHFTKIILWLKDGQRRELNFQPNKVNVITGDSNTGKTAVLEIIDYCFFASKSKISQSVINENVLWYGLLFNINDKQYTIARKSLREGKVSKDYYFASFGEIPDKVMINNSEGAIKSILESEFSIDSNVVIPYGSNMIKAGSKVSLRFFLLFNTISGNIIENDSGIFFDKQNEPRYRDALPRIFDLAVGIETIENVLKGEERERLKKKYIQLERNNNKLSEKAEDFKREKQAIIKIAQEYGLISSELDFDKSMDSLKEIISNIEHEIANNAKTSNTVVSVVHKREQYEREFYLKERKIRNLKKFISEFSTYKRNIENIEDSLKPIEFLRDKNSDLIKTSVFDDLVQTFSIELSKIRKTYKKKTPIDNQINDAIKVLEKELLGLKNNLSILPEENKAFENDRAKHIFIGEVKSKINLFSSSKGSFINQSGKALEDLEEQINNIQVDDVSQKKELTIKLAEEIISEYIEFTSECLENYGDYKPVFNYKDKELQLRAPKTSNIENVGSSSNHMFLQLFFTLANQELAFQNKSPFVAPYLIIDQPSRPYYGDAEIEDDNLKHSDESKITNAFALLDNFIETRIKNKGGFQMIVFEHIPSKIFDNMKNVYLVEVFKNGNALIPKAMNDE